MFFEQIKPHGDNFSYVFADESTNEAAVLDSSFNVDEIVRVLRSKGLVLKYIFCTHGHWDHVAGNEKLQSILGGKIVAHKYFQAKKDIEVEGGEILSVGDVKVEIIFTPGHSRDGICLLVGKEKLLTGDTLFVGECGRTDLPGGDAKKLYESLFFKLLQLADYVEVYPGHNYGVRMSSTIGEEKTSNYVLKPRSEEEFIKFMGEP
jgi:hydroxyacylglutathione hydrolase